MISFVLGVVLLCGVHQTMASCPTGCRCTYVQLDMYNSLECNNMSLTELPRANLDIWGKFDLSFNELSVLTNNSFIDKGVIHLKKLLLNNNQINEIEINTFRGIRYLTHLNLQYNDITAIKTGALDHLQNLSVLKMNNNHRLQLPDTGFILPSLRIFDFAHCNLSAIPTDFFKNMHLLDILYLQNNKLNFLDPNLIKPLKELEYMNLRGNQFTRLQVELLTLPHSIDIEFAGNPFRCTCELQKAYFLYKTRFHSDLLVCSTPQSTELLEPLASNLNCLGMCDNASTKDRVWLLLLINVALLQLLF